VAGVGSFAQMMLVQSRDRALEALSKAVSGTVEQVEKDLFALADKSRSSGEQQVLLDAMVHLRAHRAGLVEGFEQHFPEEFDRRMAGEQARAAATTPQAGGGASLASLAGVTLVDDSSLDAQLIVSELANLARNRIDPDQMRAIQMRTACLCGIDVDDASRNPLAPETFFEALNRAAQALPGGDKEHRALLQALHPYVTRALGEFYAETNEWLADNGVLQTLRWSVQRSGDVAGGGADGLEGDDAGVDMPTGAGPASAGYRGGAPTGEAGTGKGAIGFGPPITERGRAMMANVAGAANDRVRLVEALTGVLDAPAEDRRTIAHLLAEPERHGFGPALETPATPSLLTTLAGHQRDQLDGTAARQVLQAMSEEEKQKSHPLDVLTIEFVALVFDAILEDSEIAATVRAEIARLQIVAVKAAILDRTFFANRIHPIRRLIDRIAAIAVEPEIDTAEGSVFVKGLHVLVRELTAEFEEDLSVFTVGMKRLEALADAAREAAAKAVSESVAEIERKEREEFARAASIGEIRRRISPRTPEFVQNFLLSWWLNAVIAAYGAATAANDDGRDGGAANDAPGEDDVWAKRLEVVDALVWSVTLSHASQVNQLGTLLPRLMKSLIAGMDAANMPKPERDAFFKALMKAHTDGIVAAKARGNAPLEEERAPNSPSVVGTPPAADPKADAARGATVDTRNAGAVDTARGGAFNTTATGAINTAANGAVDTTRAGAVDTAANGAVNTAANGVVDTTRATIGSAFGGPGTKVPGMVDTTQAVATPASYRRLPDQHDKAVQALAEGALFDITENGAKPRRWKLTWISPGRQTFLMVTQGEPARSFTTEELSAGLRSKRIKPGKEKVGGILDRAIARLLRIIEGPADGDAFGFQPKN
jgi:hypothetical protein